MPTMYTTGDALVTAVKALMPRRLYGALQGEPYAQPLSVTDVVIPNERLQEVLDAIRALPDELALAARASDGWRELPLEAVLRAWGWNGSYEPDRGVRIFGISGDMVTAEQFAVLTAFAGALISEPWFFGAERDRQPLFALEFAERGLILHDDPYVDVQYGVSSYGL